MVDFNGSFASPLADASVVAQLANPSELVSSFLNGLTVWTAILYLALAAVFYDQGMLRRVLRSIFARRVGNKKKKKETNGYSEIHLPQGLHCRPIDENPVYGPLLAIR